MTDWDFQDPGRGWNVVYLGAQDPGRAKTLCTSGRGDTREKKKGELGRRNGNPARPSEKAVAASKRSPRGDSSDILIPA